MADIRLYKGGTPDISFMNCEGHAVTSRPPFGYLNRKKTPPFDAHYDGAYAVATFAAGFPFIPSEIPYMRDNITNAQPDGLAVNDIMQMIVIPCNHYVDSIRFDIGQPDKNLAGCTVELVAQAVEWDPTANSNRGGFVLNEISDISVAATAQGVSTPIDVSEPTSVVIWMGNVVNGYAHPLYAAPIFTTTGSGAGATIVRHQSGAIILGVKVISLPTDAEYGIHMALNDWYLSCRMTGFEAPGGL